MAVNLDPLSNKFLRQSNQQSQGRRPQEAIGSSMGGGFIYPSNFIGPTRPKDFKVPSAPNKSVLGDQTGPQPISPSVPQQQDQGQTVDDVLEPTPEQPQIDFDALIRPAIEGLEAAIGPLQQSAETTIQSLTGEKEREVGKAKAEFGQQERTLDQSKKATKQRGESAADEARRQFAEIQQGLQSRFGGTTGTGRFAGEILGAQTTRNIANIREQVGNALVQIDDRTQQVQELGRIAIQDIEQSTRDRIQQARDQLGLQLADIRRQKGEIQSRKAELAANAIQLFKNTVNEVNARNASFKQQLFGQQQQAVQQLQLARQKAAQAAAKAPNLQFKTVGDRAFTFNPQTGQATPVTAPVSVGNVGTGQQGISGLGLELDEDEQAIVGGQF